METCETCRWWNWLAEDTGSCRRNAPLVTGGLHTPIETVWPETDVKDYCGEYSPTPTKEMGHD